RIGARILFRLQRHPERAPERVEVVDVERTQVDLQRVEHVGQIEAQELRLAAVEIVVVLRRGSAERGEHGLAVDLRLFPCLRNQRLRDFIDRLAALAGEVLDLELEPPEGAEAGY